MKKNLFVLALSFFVSVNAFAIFIPGQERPVFTSELRVENAAGIYARAELLRVTKFTVDGSGQSGFIVSIDGAATKKLFIQSVNSIGCGSKEIVATEFIDPRAIQGSLVSMVIIDHSARHCMDMPANFIEVDLEYHEQSQLEPIGTLSANGTIEPVFTIQ